MGTGLPSQFFRLSGDKDLQCRTKSTMWAQQNLEAFLDFALSLIFSVVFINRRLVSVAYQLIKVSLSSCSSTESYCGACFFQLVHLCSVGTTTMQPAP